MSRKTITLEIDPGHEDLLRRYATKQFRRSWWARLVRLGLAAMARLHVLGDGASWIWKAADRVLSGCRHMLDIYHAGGRFAAAGKRLYGEGTVASTAPMSMAATCS